MFELDGPICEQAQDHIHADECVMVYGYSAAIELFIKAAARERRFQLVIIESDPGLTGTRLANSLAKLPNIAITLIPDSGIYAIMSRINKVLLAPLAVMADGGALCSNGLLMVALAAKVCAILLAAIPWVVMSCVLVCLGILGSCCWSNWIPVYHPIICSQPGPHLGTINFAIVSDTLQCSCKF
jgi:hypothetical protein